MTVLHGRKLAGKAWQVFPNGILVTPPTLVIRSIAGQTTGGTSAVSLSFAGGAPAALAATVDSVPVAISGVSILTVSGAAGTAAGTATFTIDTPDAGSHAVVVSSAGTFAARSDPFTLVTAAIPPPPPPPPPVPPGTAPPVLSGIRITQNAALWPNQKEGTPVAYCDPVGGIGPFLWGMTDPSGLYHIDATSGDITISSAIIGTATHTLTVACYDARIIAKGLPYSPATQSFTVAKLDVSASGMAMNSRNPVDNCTLTRSGLASPQDGPYFAPCAYGADHTFTRDNVTISDASKKWVRHTANTTQWGIGQPTPGSYPVTFTGTSQTGDVQTLTTTLQVVQFTPITYIELAMSVAVVSTATVLGRIIGKLCAITPNNSPLWTINDPTGTITVNQSTGDVTLVKAPVAGTFQFLATVVDGLASLSNYLISIPVLQGNVLPPGNMRLIPNALDNSRQNQSVGTPTVTGVTGVPTWSITAQTGYNDAANNVVFSKGFQNPARYQIDAKTGAITTAAAVTTSTAAMLSYQRTDYGYIPDQITVSCTDGLNTCTAPFTIPVAEAPTTYLFVNRGSNTPPGGVVGTDMAGATPAAQLSAANVRCGNFHPGIKYHVYVWPTSDPDGYTDATRGNRSGWIGPVRIEGVTVNGQRPRFGGLASNAGVSSGTSDGSKGFLLMSHGDAEVVNIEGAYSHGGDSSHGLEFIRKDGNTYGNLYLERCYIHDSDQGLETGVCHGYVTVESCVFSQCGGASVGTGLTHNLYIGSISRFTMRNSVTRRVLYGYLLKCRAAETIVDNCRFFDTPSGAAGQCINLPYIGKVSITNSVLMKGPFATNPFVISAGEDGPLYDTNTVTIANNVIDMRSLSYGGTYGPITAFNHFFMNSPNGQVPSQATLTNNRMLFSPLAVSTSGDTHFITPAAPAANATVETGTITLTVPPALDVSDPSMPGSNLPAPGRPYRHRAILEGDMFGNFSNVLQMHASEEFRVGRTDPIGTAIGTVDAIGDIIDNPGGDPFATGATYAIVFDKLSTSNANPWAAPGAFTLAANSGGTATLRTAAALSTGLYFVKVRATAPDGVTISDTRLPVIVSDVSPGGVSTPPSGGGSGTPAPASVYYVGRGMAAAHPGVGFETFAEAKAILVNETLTLRTVNVLADVFDTNYYADDNGLRTGDSSLRFALQGPLNIVGVANGAVSRPRFGGVVGAASGGGGILGDGFLVVGDGAVTLSNLELSYCRNGVVNTPGTGIAGVRKVDGTSGDLNVTNCVFHDCDDAIITGAGPGVVNVQNCDFTGSGQTAPGSGFVCNVTVGAAARLVFQNNTGHVHPTGYALVNAALDSALTNNVMV